ncbi:hypothetical protein VitviT2T_012325 [Vitis vinifera]|uniref:Retrovirus-related Pol polyprotein from transposon RE1 n=1 Tax=Vitis vinifera TaxID=29760 RepID=A0ABY9CGT3_VITVI|nr:hypothetical protein VitviT2T_012325 [Vitis vinifera]
MDVEVAKRAPVEHPLNVILAQIAQPLIPITLPPLHIQLSRTNYSFWKSQILPAVRAYGLEGFLTSDHVHPPATIADANDPQVFVENPDFLYWTCIDQFLVSWLIGSISEAMLGHVIRCTSTTKIWSTLHEVFGIQSKARILQLRQQLQLKKCATLVNEYVLKKRTLAYCLIATGQPIFDDEVILYILSGLSPEYESVVVNITSKNHITLQCVMFMLQNHEQRIESCESTTQVDVNGASVHYATKERTLSTLVITEAMAITVDNLVVHEVCRKLVHIALKCYHQFDLSYQGQEAAANANSANTSSTTYTNLQAYMTAPSSGDPNNNSWFLDSGATHHITTDSSNLASKNDYNGKEKLDLITGATLLKGVHDRGLYHLELSPTRTTRAFLAHSSQPESCSSFVIDTPMVLTLPVSNALSDNACSSFSNSTTGSASLHSCLATGTIVPVVDNIVSTPCTHVVQLITATMSQPLLHTSTNIHSMQTRFKSGIYKPKVYTVVVALPDHF